MCSWLERGSQTSSEHLRTNAYKLDTSVSSQDPLVILLVLVVDLGLNSSMLDAGTCVNYALEALCSQPAGFLFQHTA